MPDELIDFLYAEIRNNARNKSGQASYITRKLHAITMAFNGNECKDVRDISDHVIDRDILPINTIISNRNRFE